jgi:hypothetical protein
LLARIPSARVRGVRVPTGLRLVARAVAVDLESNTRSSRCSSAHRFVGLAQLSGCGAGGGEPNHPQHLMQEDGAEFAPLVTA